MLLLLGWSWLLSSFVLHMCAVQSYLYPITRNKNLKLEKHHNTSNTSPGNSCARSHSKITCFAIYWKLKSASWNIAYIVKIIYFLICCTVHLSKYTKPTLLFRNTVKSDLAHALNFSTAVNLSIFFFSFQFYIGFNDPSFLSKESQQLYEIWWFATTLILIRLELGISMTFRFGCQGTPSHWLHSTLLQSS